MTISTNSNKLDILKAESLINWDLLSKLNDKEIDRRMKADIDYHEPSETSRKKALTRSVAKFAAE